MSDEIDQLEGVELAGACAEAMGWKIKANVCPVRGVEWNDFVDDSGKIVHHGDGFNPADDTDDTRRMLQCLSRSEANRFNSEMVKAWGAARWPLPMSLWAWLAPLETICRAFLKAKAGAGVKP